MVLDRTISPHKLTTFRRLPFSSALPWRGSVAIKAQLSLRLEQSVEIIPARFGEITQK